MSACRRESAWGNTLLELVEAHAGTCRIELKVTRRRLDGLLLVAGQAGEAIDERIGDHDVHERLSGLGIIP
jgi:hypothetical protein